MFKASKTSATVGLFAVITAMVLSGPMTTPASAIPVNVPLQNATTTHQQAFSTGVAGTIDGDLTAGAGMAFIQTGSRTGNTIIAYETAADIIGNGELTFTITQNFGGSHTLQSFRLSVTDADRSLFADGVTANGDVHPFPSQWTLLDNPVLTFANPTTATVDANGIITLSGANPTTNVLTIKAANPLGTVTGIRLEVLPGSNGSVGRASNGNAFINEFAVAFDAGALPAVAQRKVELALTNATATFSQAGFGPNLSIDGIMHGNTNGWAVSGGQATEQSAVFQTQAPVDARHGLAFELMHGYLGTAGHKIQNFALYYTTDAAPTATDGSIDWIALTPTAAETTRGDSFALIDGNIIRITGNTAQDDNYQILVDGAYANITGFRLQVLPGDNGFLGFETNGNIVLSEFRVFLTTPIPEPASLSLLALAGLAMMTRRRNA